MNFFLSVGVTFMFITSNTQLYSQTNNGGDSLLADAIFATYNEQWSAGLSFMREIEMRQPNSAVSSFYIGSLYFRRLYSTLNHSYKDSAKVHFEKAYSIAEAQYEKDENDEEALFYYGGASGYLGMYHAYDKNYLSAAKYGVKGVKLLKKLLSINPNKYDAYLGLGIYSYSASKAPVYLRWLVSLWGVDTNIKTSFLYLEKAVANGTYARTEAKDKLCNFYLAEKRFPDALTLVHELKSEFPNGSWFNFLEVLIHYKSKNWADVIKYSRTYAELSNKSTAYVRKVTAYLYLPRHHLTVVS